MTESKIRDKLVDYIIQFESGELDAKKTLELFSELIKSGKAWELQGMYGRMARDLIESGVISEDGKINWKKARELGLLANKREKLEEVS
jgi:hypothetical protein